jgi:hypothetical protein
MDGREMEMGKPATREYVPTGVAVGQRAGHNIVYVVEGLASVAANLLLMGIFFYTQRQFGWGLSSNLMLASGQGAFYVVGALAAGRAAERLGRRRLLLLLQAALASVALLCIALPTAPAMAALVLVYSMLSAVQWPLMESWACSGGGTGTPRDQADRLAQRVGRYNLVWSGVNAATLAGSGVLIQWWPAGVFLLAAVSNVAAGLLVLASDGAESAAAGEVGGPAPAAEPELAAMRTEALWLSRIALPSSYVLVYSLSAMLPSLGVLRPLATGWRTIVGSIWFASRWVMFAVLGRTVFWHTRPRLMLAATALMGLAFLGTALRPSDVWPALGESAVTDLALMIGWQILLGAAMGLIYAASLYFGMVLSHGSTEHGGYHEALIGLGSTLGPAAAAAAHRLDPDGVRSSATTVAGIIAVSLAGAAVASINTRRRRAR